MNVTTTITTATIPVQEPTVMQILQLVIPIVAVFLAYCIGRRTARNERLFEDIYRPLMGQLGVIRDSLQNGVLPNTSLLMEITLDGLYFSKHFKEKDQVDNLQKWIDAYIEAYYDAKPAGTGIIQHAMEMHLLKDPKLPKYLSGGDLLYRSKTGGHVIPGRHIKLSDSLVIGEHPYEFLNKKGVFILSENECTVGVDRIDPQIAGKIAESALQESQKDKDFKWLWYVRDEVVKGIASLIKMLEKHV